MNTTHGRIGNVSGSSELVEMAMAFARSCTLCAAARLGVADALADGERTVAELADTCSANVDSLYRLLRALVGLGVTVETAPGRFVLTPFGEPLRKNARHSEWSAVVFWSDLLAENWTYLADCVRTGNTASNVMESRGITSRWFQDPDAGAIFRAVMGTAPSEEYMSIVRKWNFSKRQLVADLGGGGGALLCAILKTHSHLGGMLVERPATIEGAKQRFEAERLAARCRFVAADLGEAVPSGADVYLIKHVLHGYRDDAAITILKNCRAVIPSDGFLLIVEFVLPDVISHTIPNIEGRLMSDLNMMVVTGGRERSTAQWTHLLRISGFELRRIIPVGSDTVSAADVSIIEATPILPTED